MPRSHPTEKSVTPSGLLPIRTVASLTGVNPVTLRAWERRYNLVTPHRTPKGHRLYTRENVELIKQILDFLDQGLSISQVKPLLDQTPAEISAAPAAEETPKNSSGNSIPYNSSIAYSILHRDGVDKYVEYLSKVNEQKYYNNFLNGKFERDYFLLQKS